MREQRGVRRVRGEGGLREKQACLRAARLLALRRRGRSLRAFTGGRRGPGGAAPPPAALAGLAGEERSGSRRYRAGAAGGHCLTACARALKIGGGNLGGLEGGLTMCGLRALIWQLLRPQWNSCCSTPVRLTPALMLVA